MTEVVRKALEGLPKNILNRVLAGQMALKEAQSAVRKGLGEKEVDAWCTHFHQAPNDLFIEHFPEIENPADDIAALCEELAQAKQPLQKGFQNGFLTLLHVRFAMAALRSDRVDPRAVVINEAVRRCVVDGAVAGQMLAGNADYTSAVLFTERIGLRAKSLQPRNIPAPDVTTIPEQESASQHM